MPDLKSLLASYDLAFTRDIAELWGVELHTAEKRAAWLELANAMTSDPLFEEVIASLPSTSLAALYELCNQNGKMAWQAFEHSFGELRPMGPTRRKREKPHRFPQNTAERLWYMGLVGRATLLENQELSEFAYIPEEFLGRLQNAEITVPAGPAPRQLPAWASAKVIANPPREDQILDDLCTLFAALRMDFTQNLPHLSAQNSGYWQLLLTLAKALGLLDKKDQPNEDARVLLEKPRGEALKWTAHNWAQNPGFDELCLMPQLRCEGNWQHSPIAPRLKVLDLLAKLPTETWFKMEDFTDEIFRHQPDFLRGGTDYNTWIISSTGPDARLLHGFEHWQDVEGQYVRFLIADLLVVFGLAQTGQVAEQPESQTFRLTPWFGQVLGSEAPFELPEESQPVLVGSDGRLEMPPLVPRFARYQLSRFTEWRRLGSDRFTYQLTPASLQAAAEQGLELKHLRSLLRKYGKPGIPPALQKALSRWESHGREARIEPLLVLSLAEPELLDQLRESRASGCLGETLGAAAVVVKPGCEARVRAALGEMGILTDLPGEDE